MEIRGIKTLIIEVFKTINELNRSFYIFRSNTNSRVRSFNFLVKNYNIEKYDSKSLIALWQNIWNTLPENVKKEYPSASSRNILNRGQVGLENVSKCLEIMENH